MLSAMKGPGKTLMTYFRDDRSVDLIAFDDGSWGIKKDGSVVGAWENSEERDCVDTFAKMAGIRGEFGEPQPLVVLRVRKSGTAAQKPLLN